MSTYLQQAQVLIDLKRWVQAAEALRRELAECPGNPLAHRLLALSLAWQGHLSEARTAAQEAIRLQPDNDYAHQILGWIFFKEGHYSDAEKEYWEAIRLNPRESHHFSMLAHVCGKKGSWSSCAFVAREGLRINPNDSACASNLAAALINTNRPKEAEAVLAAAMKRDPENCWFHFNQGVIDLNESKLTKSLQHFREAARLDPENKDTHRYIKQVEEMQISTILIVVSLILGMVILLLVPWIP